MAMFCFLVAGAAFLLALLADALLDDSLASDAGGDATCQQVLRHPQGSKSVHCDQWL